MSKLINKFTANILSQTLHRTALGIFFLCQSALIATASDLLVGQAIVIDGDTIEIRGERIRLDGIDAPESRQLCYQEGKPLRCGQVASFYLDDLIGDRNVSCTLLTKDRYGRWIGACKTNEADLNGSMVSSGMAVAYRRYSTTYIPHESAARKAGVGIWATRFEMPWDLRRAN